MLDFDTLAMPVGLVVVVVVLGWFAWGTTSNVRAGDRVLKWLRDGLPLLGEKATMHWMGSSVLQLKIAKARNPYRNTETLFVFEPRDVIFLWLWSRLRGRRDLMIFRGTTSATPKFEMEIYDQKGWTTHQTERDVKKQNWAALALPEYPALQAYHTGNVDSRTAKQLVDLATRAGAKLVRVSIHRSVPNVEVHWLLPNPQTHSAHDLFTHIREIGEQAMRG